MKKKNKGEFDAWISKPIITDFDDNDCYKFFMQYAVFKLYPEAMAEYTLILRDAVKFPDGFADELVRQISYFENLRFTPAIEVNFKRRLPYFDNTYYQWLRGYQYDSSEVTVKQVGTDLHVTVRGYWVRTILWEVPLMATISELYFKFNQVPDFIEINIPRWEEKYRIFATKKIRVSEFGTRRRKSKAVQEEAIRTFIRIAPEVLVGTSNVMFSRLFNIPAHGTQAHEWYMFHAVKYGVQMANRMGLGRWVDVYHGALGTALSDTFTTDVFLRDFDLFFAKLFDGPRQDSGNPVTFAEKMIKHYRDMNITIPITFSHGKTAFIPKTIVFSDSIDSHEKIDNIEEAVFEKILSAYGIGVWISFDIVDLAGVKIKHINMVIKMTSAKPDDKMPWGDCVKLSDSTGKHTGNQKTVELYKTQLGIE